MANEVSAVSNITTDPTLLTGETYTKTSTSITGSVAKGSPTVTFIGLEIVDASNAVLRRKESAVADAAPNNAQITAQLATLTGSTVYKCRMYRGDVSLGDLNA